MFENKLMIIEDDEKIADLIRRVAFEIGFDTRIAHNNLSFIPVFEEFKPDILVLDILMPGMDGFEVIQFLHGRGSKVRVIILSGDEYFREMAAKFGDGLGLNIDITLAKPFRIHELRLALQEIQYSLPSAEKTMLSEIRNIIL